MKTSFAAAALVALAPLVATCARPEARSEPSVAADVAVDGDPTAGWDVIYRVLVHPRCLNCHPSGDAPLQGDDSHPHAQNVQRGPDGHGRFAMRCETCHSTQNLPGPHLPPGAPTWHLPEPRMPLVFQGRSSSELCRQIQDPAQNGGKTLDQISHHIADDRLVGWGWDPGEGRAPVPIPREKLVEALRSWIAGGCRCP